MKYFLIVTKGKHAGYPIPIKIDLFLFGSDPACQLRSQMAGVGARHCALMTREKKLFIRDLGSGARTVMNGEQIPPDEEWPVHAGDRLAVGPLEFMIQFNERQLSQRDLEEWALTCLDQREQREEDGSLPYEEEEATPASAAASILDRLQAKKGVVKGRLRIGFEGNTTIIRFNDVHLVQDAEIVHVKKELLANLKTPKPRVLLDFKNVRRMSTAAAEMLVVVYHHLKERGLQLAMSNVRAEVMPLFETVEILKPIPFFPNKEIAIASSWEPQKLKR